MGMHQGDDERVGVMRAQVAWRTMVVEEEKEVAYVTCNEGE